MGRAHEGVGGAMLPFRRAFSQNLRTMLRTLPAAFAAKRSWKQCQTPKSFATTLAGINKGFV